jgi:hypothetical protein
VTGERLRSSFVSFRQRAAALAGEIHRDLPDLTVHDITHLDALWEIADIISGGEFRLTPTEGYVLGGAFLLHDLALSVAAYPSGIEELKRGQKWNDVAALQFVEKYNRRPTPEELSSPPQVILTSAMAHLLRRLHAEQAERLGMMAWSPSKNGPQQYLIEDTEIRQTYGRIVGLIAHSHWWSIQDLEQKFPRTLGAPYWCPKDWTVDPLKVACLLRLADAGHIDSRRAPPFLRALRHISPPSLEHWAFQEKLSKPHLSGDSLCYTSGYAFPFGECACWWLCFDTLRMIDGELRRVDALLADKGMQRFAARRIAGIESPDRLTPYIPTAGWTPVDARVQVSDVPRLLKCLGGEELYGASPRIPLRELVQNAADALRARWIVEGRPENWGKVTVRLGSAGDRPWLEVEDNGIGMSPAVLTSYLLDFASTYWGSSLMIDELPGLLGSGFVPTGKYGIGFFSIFMLGDAVRIRTRRFDAAQKDTVILEFNTGLSSRPVLREAERSEMLQEGGTCVRIWVRVEPTEQGGLLRPFRDEDPRSLHEVCEKLCPALPVNLSCEEKGRTAEVIVGSDWVKIPGEELLKRTQGWFDRGEDCEREACAEYISLGASNLRLLRGPDGKPVGRACVGLNEKHKVKSKTVTGLSGVVAVGGLKAASLRGIAGILVGEPARASRDDATPIVPAEELVKWATEQASLVSKIYDNPDDLMECATIVRRCGATTALLPIAKHDRSYLNFDEIASLDLPDEVMLIDTFEIRDLEELPDFQYAPGVLVSETGSWLAIVSSSSPGDWPDKLTQKWGGTYTISTTLGGAVVEAVAKAWGVPLAELGPQAISREREQEERVIGRVGSREIRRNVLLLERSRTT